MYAFHLGTWLISWAFKKQPIVTISFAETKYVVLSNHGGMPCSMAMKTCEWFRHDLAQIENDPTPILYDNSSTIALSKNHIFHKKSKHIDTCYHISRELVNNGDITLHFFGSRDQLEDILTKP